MTLAFQSNLLTLGPRAKIIYFTFQYIIPLETSVRLCTPAASSSVYCDTGKVDKKEVSQFTLVYRAITCALPGELTRTKPACYFKNQYLHMRGKPKASPLPIDKARSRPVRQLEIFHVNATCNPKVVGLSKKTLLDTNSTL